MRLIKALILTILTMTLASCEFGDNVESNNLITIDEANNSILHVISISPPQDGVYGIGGTLDFEVVFDDDVTVSGSPCLILDIGGVTRSSCYSSGSKTNTLTFSYTVAIGDNDNDGITLANLISLNGGELNSSKFINDLDTSEVSPTLTGIQVDTSFLPPDKVTAVTQTNLSVDRTQVFFNWVAPSDNGNPISHYIVRYKKSGASSYSYLSPNPITTSTTITDLESGNVYDIQVSASNGVIGPYSNTLNVSTIFSPKTLGALIWYEAKDILGDGSTVADGTSVETLVDKSGSSNNASKISGTAATIETVSGKKVISLGSSGYRTINSLGETANTDIEVYIIAKTRSISASFAFVNENEGNSNRFGTHFPWSNSSAYVDLPIGDRVYGHWGGNTTDFLAWTFRGSTTQGIALERNATPVLTGGNRTLTPPLKKWTIGSSYAGTSKYWKADLQAIFVFEKILDAQQRTDFYQYIEDEYGVTMN